MTLIRKTAHETYKLDRPPMATEKDIATMASAISTEILDAVALANGVAIGKHGKAFAASLAGTIVRHCPVCEAWISPHLATQAGVFFGVKRSANTYATICPMCWTPIAQRHHDGLGEWSWVIDFESFPGLREHVADVTRRRAAHQNAKDSACDCAGNSVASESNYERRSS